MLGSLRYATATLCFEDWWKRRRRARSAKLSNNADSTSKLGTTPLVGYCPICSQQVAFLTISDAPRERLQCVNCGSVPRQRALATALQTVKLAKTDAHECSPSLCTFWFFRRQCRTFQPSYYWPNRRFGARVGAMRNVNLGRQPFANDSFDLVVTQDVLEHVPAPQAALREIHRTLRPGKSHVFTVPRNKQQPTTARAELQITNPDSNAPDHVQLHHLKPPEYHRDPINKRGSLVITDWGVDLEERIAQAVPGVTCSLRVVQDPALGIPHPIEVFIANNPA